MRSNSGEIVASAQWWEKRWFLVLVIFATTIPLLSPQVAPFPDLPGHIGRYLVELEPLSSPTLQRYFQFEWKSIGNLGVDLLVIPLAPVFGLELAVKLITIATAALSAAAMIWVAREVHGRVPPTALFAIPFVYSFPFNYGFINFSLSIALALGAFALWLTFAQKPRLRAAIFVPLAVLVWLTHALGWGVLGLLVWSSEIVSERQRHATWIKSVTDGSLLCLPLCVPLLLMVAWRSGDVGGATAAFFQASLKVLSVASALRDRWLLWDALSVAAVVVLIGSAAFDKHLSFAPRLGIPAAVLAIVFILLPRLLLGSNYADMRLPPLVLTLAMLALNPRENASPNVRNRIAIIGMIFVGARLIGNAISFGIADAEAREQLTALNFIPTGARVLTLVGDSCGKRWAMPRHTHLGSYVIVRKYGFSNDQWDLAGAQLLRVRYLAAGKFMADPSEMTVSAECRSQTIRRFRNQSAGLREYINDSHRTADQSLRQFPRSAFDYVWLIRPEGFTGDIPGDLRPVWSGSNSRLFKVVR
jgi:hypothetical protein